ncbi:MAG: thiamine pyrophosphate-binding protein [Acidimicrobiia bacterium]
MTRNASTDIVAALESHGVEYVFGVPGDTSLPLYDALRESRSVTHVMARDERGAAYMAEVYARVSGRPGVCEAPSGAGAFYLIPGVAEAYASSIAMIALTTDIPLKTKGKNVLTEMDQEGLFDSVTKWSVQLRRPDRAAEAIHKAMRIATSGRAGPVHISLPEDVLGTPTEGAPDPTRPPKVTTFPSLRSGASAEDLRRAAELLGRAERPVIVAGGGTRISGAWAELTRVAELSGAMVGTSITGKGSIDERHPNSLGVVGGNGARPYANEAIERADLVMFVGCKTDSVTTMKWTLPPAGGTQVIQVDVDPKEVGANYPLELGVNADAKVFLGDLAATLPTDEPVSPWLDVEPARAGWLGSYRGLFESDDIPINPYRVIDALKRLLPREALIVADAGTGTPLTAAFIDSPPGREVIIPRGFGGLGYALPGVVGAAYASRSSQVVGIMGDGSFAMAAGDLETIARLSIPVLLVQFNNATFGWIKALQHYHSDQRYFGVDFSAQTDYVGVARAFGIDGIRVTHPDEIDTAIKEGLAEPRPFFIDIVTASEEETPPPVPDWFT